MDGTPYVTQCPILPASRFVYKFRARTTGTMFYHSHTSFQRGDGAFGPYIVRRTAEKEPQAELYDFDLTEHLIFPQEWFHSASREAFVLHHWDTGKNKPDNMLINGKGRNRNGTQTPYATFHVRSGFRYRFRVVSPGFTLCPIEVSVENHKLTLIASDTHAIQPIEVDSFVVHEGERFDFVLNANQKSGVYQMKFGGLFDCAKPKIHGLGLLIYDNVQNEMDAAFMDRQTDYENFVNIEGKVVNPLNFAPPKIPLARMPRIDEKHQKIPIIELKHLPSPILNDSKFFKKSSLKLDSSFDLFKTQVMPENP